MRSSIVLTDQAARVEFAKQGLCPDHPWIQLRKKNFFGQWKTVRTTCPHHGEEGANNVNENSPTKNQSVEETPTVTATATPSNPIFESMWGTIDSDLQDAFALAGAAARREGKNYISTTQLFAALRRLSPSKPLAEFFDLLPDGALPDPTPEAIPVEVQALEDITSLSPCVNAALANLSNAQQSNDQPPKLLSSQEIVVDIAMHSSGKSTVLLRTHGVDKAAVQSIVQQLGWQILERESSGAGNERSVSYD